MRISFEEFNKRFGHHEVKFVSYYKFSFCFAGETSEGGRTSVTVGGSADDIYKMAVAPDAYFAVEELDISSGTYTIGTDEFEYTGW